MTEKQLQVIVGLMSGMQIATVHLATILCQKTGTSREDLAASFEAFGETVPATVAERELIMLTLRQVAAGIRNAGNAPGQEWPVLVSKLLH